MEHNNPTTKGLCKGAKPSDDAETQKPFCQSISFLFIMFSVIGLNVRRNGKFKIIYNVLCGFQLLGTASLIPYAVLIVELTSDDTQKLVTSLQGIGAAITILLLNLQFRMSVDSLAMLIKTADVVLMRFKSEQRRPVLEKMNILKPVPIVTCISSIAVFYYKVFERDLSSEGRLLIANKQFMKLSEQYSLEVIPFVWLPLSIFASSLIAVTFVSVFIVLHFIFAHFEKSNTSSVWSPSTDDPHSDRSVNDFINLFRIHRDACELLRLTDRVFGPPFATALAMMTFHTISNARVVFVSGQAIVWSSLAGIISSVGWAFFVIIPNSKINKMFERSLSHLMQIGLQLGVDGKLSPRKAAALSAKLDLYMTYVQLDSPAMSLGGFLKIRPQLTVQICGLILSYTVYLYSK